MRSLVLIAVAFSLSGCGGKNAPLSAPSYDPEEMARAAVQQYDKNGNGQIEGAELDACPALKGALTAIDANKDKAISVDELTERFRAYKQGAVAVVGVACVVKLNNRPFEGALVTFTPEDCMKGSVQGGSGTTDSSGAVALDLPYGLYKITVSRKSGAGEELPARYNAATTLGREIGPDPRGAAGTIDLNLTSP